MEDDYFSKPNSPLKTKTHVKEIEDHLPSMQQLFDTSWSPNHLSQTSWFKFCSLDITDEDRFSSGKQIKRISLAGMDSKR